MNNYLGTIDWVKISEIIFDATLTGIISGMVIYFAYWLGKLQADKNWKRDVDRREKEIIEQDRKELINKRIEALKSLYYFEGMLGYRVTYDYFRNGTHFLDGNDKHQILTAIIFAAGLFDKCENQSVVQALDTLLDVTDWQLNTPTDKDKGIKEAQERYDIVSGVFKIFALEITNLQRQLIPEMKKRNINN